MTETPAAERQAIQGQDGWLFLTNDTNQTLRQFTGEVTFDDTQLLRWRVTHETRQAWLAQYGITYGYSVIPDKTSVYAEYAPAGVEESPARPLRALSRYLEDSGSVFRLHCPEAELRHHKAVRDVYQRTDTHLSGYGAWVAATSWVESLQSNLPVIDKAALRFHELPPSAGDLGSKFDPPITGPAERVVVPGQPWKLTRQLVAEKNRLCVLQEFSNPARPDLPKAVLFCDSFGFQMTHFLAASFSRLLALRSPAMDHHVVLVEKPDVVLVQQVERFIINIPDDFAGLAPYMRDELRADPALLHYVLA